MVLAYLYQLLSSQHLHGQVARREVEAVLKLGVVVKVEVAPPNPFRKHSSIDTT
jgi:hypothetical protein